MSDGADRWPELQRLHHAAADRRRFAWQTTNPYVSARERELLHDVACHDPTTVLEVGCGEGANVANLRKMGWPGVGVGVDFSAERIRFARGHSDGRDRFAVADALWLPFIGGSFDVVYCRDVLHHLNDPGQAIHEMARVCRAGGVVVVIEGNGRAWTNRLFAALVPAERGMRTSTVWGIRSLVETTHRDSVVLESLRTAEASNLFRIALHHRFGCGGLAKVAPIRWMLDLLGAAKAYMMPPLEGAYIIATLRKM